jgi:hypothetical protein
LHPKSEAVIGGIISWDGSKSLSPISLDLGLFKQMKSKRRKKVEFLGLCQTGKGLMLECNKKLNRSFTT